MNAFRCPVLRTSAAAAAAAARTGGLAALDRSLFARNVDLAAARVRDMKNISKYQRALGKSKELLNVDRLASVVVDPDRDLASQGKKCLLLRPGVKADDPGSWGPVLREGVQKDDLNIIPYQLHLGYDYWSYHDVMTSILPEEFHDDIPSGFNTVGHVAHLNLRERFLPYKKLVGEVLLDKNPNIRTVINKIENVGMESEYRTFEYEVLAGPDDLKVEVTEGSCIFRFDYAKVYWNSKLETEHRRIVNLFKPGEVVCDVMAGIGPFAVPAGKNGVFVWANDMNPQSYIYLKQAIEINKVSQYVRPFNEDGRTFIRKAADSVLEASRKGEYALVPAKRPVKSKSSPTEKASEPKRVPVPPVISHFVMNLPASAITFLGCYRGLYWGNEALFSGESAAKLPLIHVHCFALKSDGDVPIRDICERVSSELGVTMKPGDPDVEGEVAIHDVRDVAPAKRMFCATFRLPAQVAFAPRD
ncbi:hypothetical protein VTK73DRAFT_6214 [Phialemonium thermophilum]|uniref:tRNA (guanine(37)-N1)-methyltransferase n=1 Tax=Phialemonium thermophilum TaxID=223376 RepID=A0ABR3XX52_9PEZI